MRTVNLSLLAALLFVAIPLCSSADLEFKGSRNLTGGDIVKDCSPQLPGIFPGTCKCKETKPFFHVNSNTTYGCTTFKVLCQVCKDVATASVRNSTSYNETVISFNLPTQSLDADFKENCAVNNTTEVRFYINQKHNMILILKTTGSVSTVEESTKVDINITKIPFDLTGKLGKIQLWCNKGNSSYEEMEIMKKSNTFIVKINGEFEEPDNTTYFLVTTPTPLRTSVPSFTTAAVKDSTSRNMIFYVVIPVAFVLILACVIILCINKKDKEMRENSYNFKDPRLSEDSELGHYNKSYAIETIDKNGKDRPDGKTKSPNNNDSIKEAESNDNINIYTTVDLPSHTHAQHPVPVEHQQHLQRHTNSIYESPVDFRSVPDNSSVNGNDKRPLNPLDTPVAGGKSRGPQDSKYRQFSNNSSDVGSVTSDDTTSPVNHDSDNEDGEQIVADKKEQLEEEADEIIRACEKNYEEMEQDGTLKRLNRMSKHQKFIDFGEGGDLAGNPDNENQHPPEEYTRPRFDSEISSGQSSMEYVEDDSDVPVSRIDVY